MNLPKKIKHFNFFLDGDNYAGTVNEIEPPAFTRKMEEYRGGGMILPVKADMGLEALEMTVKMGGVATQMTKKMGAATHDAVRARFVGSLEREDKCHAYALEIEVNGRFEEIKLPNAKSGEDGESEFKLTLSYVKITLDGEEICEIDALNMIEKWYGVDRLAEHRRNIGI